MKKKVGKHGVQSFEIGMYILQVILNGPRGMKLKEIATAAGMPSSKVHRYIVSMVRSGLIEQDEDSSQYDLGPLAMNIGLVAVDRINRIKFGIKAISELCTETNETTALSTWSINGPVVVRWMRPSRAVAVSVMTGTALSMVTTASGCAFGAYLSPEKYDHLLKSELNSPNLPEKFRSRSAIEKLFERTREMGVAIVEGHHVASGVAAVGAPVFDAKNEIVLVITVVGLEGRLDTDLDGHIVMPLREKALELSKKLGFQGFEVSGPELDHN
ncbi:IclR family transcriptional regulator [Desulfotignum balticum]|uniref:IclR family transcriptional regulator n=1 Tax=Desulfotignum balticum TaxID=115781 RepID=UPI00041D0756|nr:IclR family transcriptional regulator [Desulfotignum balticum]